ncbi:uncharacterized protein LOC101458451 isoform X1 [Ceratitis capitata]|uniref:uncharacterized protein LOC101458451 isoform X1 n=1 Tax=Ceratitis capitata TaxID=7213 RepID=UPI000329B5DF|nr:uncharacterized protein LOC101458451 isoform X1 [Ceratitis capitata]
MVYMFLSVVANYVSLPGAGTSPTEQQQTILEVLNNKIVQQQQQAAEVASTETATAGTSTTQPTVEEEDATNATTHEVIASAVNVPLNELEDDLVSNSQSTTNTESSLSNESATSQIPYSVAAAAAAVKTSQGTTAESTIQRPTNKTETVSDTEAAKEGTTTTTPSADGQQSTNSATGSGHSAAQGHVLDIESHLIETYKDYQGTDESVGINELPPQQDELTAGSSKVETDVNVRTVIEVEPAGAISKKPIEILVRTSRAQRADSESHADDIVEVKAAPEEIVTASDCEEQKTEADVKRRTSSEAEKELKTQVQAEELSSELPTDTSDAIKATAERLVNEIEREVLEALRKCEGAQAEVKVEATKNALEAAAQKLNNNDDDLPCQRLDERNIKEDEKTEQATSLLDEISNSLTQKVDAQLSEVTSILKSSKQSHVALQLSGVNGEALKVDVDQTPNNELKIVNVPSPKTPLDEEERKRFLESLPHLDSNAEAQKLADDCKREYYQSLKKYLIQGETDRPPVPLQTYRWEDLRRAKERGGYPWTHLYKRPLGPDEEPEIVLLLRKSQEFRFVSESPKSLKKVRIDEQVIIKQPERYIQELSEAEEDYPQSAPEDEETHSLRSESISCVSDSVLATGKPRKSTRLDKIRGYLRRRKGGRTNEDAQSLPCASNSSSRRHSQENITPPAQPPNPQILLNGNNTEQKHCYPIMKKLKSMADRQKKRLNIKRIHLGKDEKIVLGEETKILKLKKSPKAERGEIPHFIEKQDSDDVLEIMELDESPSRKRRDDGRQEDERQEIVQAVKDDNEQMDANQAEAVSIVVPDEIIEIPQLATDISEQPTTSKEAEATQPPESTVSEPVAIALEVSTTAAPPKKAPRLRREHVYEEIESEMPPEVLAEPPNASVGLLELAAVEALKESLAKQDNTTFKHIEEGAKSLPLDRMGSSEEEQIAAATATAATDKPAISLLAPLSSVDSASSDEDRNRAQLSPVTEESDAASVEDNLRIIDDNEPIDLKPAIKKEASPAPSDKKVTFSHVEDEAEPHREDIELPTEVQEEAAQRKKWTNMSDHEYEPISAPAEADGIITQLTQSEKSNLARNIAMLHEDIKATDSQQDLDESYISSAATTPRTESRTDYEIHTSQVDSSALEELPLKPENRKKSFMASAQDRTRKMQAGLKSQAGKIKTKLRTPAKKPASSSPKAKERKRFKAPEFSKIKMPEIKRPDMSKLKDFKRPEFTKFNKPDMSKFKLPEKFSTLKLKRSKSFKENETQDEELENGAQPATDGVPAAQPHKKIFDFNFGTYPRAFRKKKPLPAQESLGTETGTEGVSVIPSTETQPSQESSNSPQGDRGPGPVRSRWADKFSDVSYNDSEGSRYRRYGSEQESFDRESSLERRMKDDMEESESVAQEMGILGGVADTKQFAEFDEENRAIHEISKMRAGEFRRRPMVHQDSDLRSEDSKDVEGWTEKEIEKNKLLRKAELEAEGSYLKYTADDVLPQETQSTASSGKKVVMEEIDDDEFFLRKRGVSEDNIELRRYISNAIREGYDRPLNTLEHVGQPNEYRDYDIPPPKPKRLHKTYQPQDVSQDFESQRSEYGDDLSMSQNGSDYYNAPKRPLRKGRSRSKYSMDSQEFPVAESMRHEPYFDDDEEYLRPPRNSYKEAEDEIMEMNDLDIVGKQVFPAEPEGVKDGAPPPQAPRRRKRDTRDNSMDSKDSYMNGFGGRSVSNTRLQPTEDVIVYRTEHEYPIPIDATEKFEPTVTTRKSRSINRYEEDDRISRGADSLGYEEQDEMQVDAEANVDKDKFVIDMMENDGYAIVRKDHMPKPTPPARRKKFSRSPGERFASISSGSAKSATPPPPERPPPPRAYTPSTMEEPVPPRRKSITSLELAPQILEDDYEEPEALQQERPESPRDLQSGEIINKMKFRPLPPPPRPPREKRQRAESKSSAHSAFVAPHERDLADERLATSSTADSYDPTDVDLEEEETRLPEVEVSTQTDPLPDDFECEEFEITEDMRIIEPRINSMRKTLDELLREEELKIKSSEDSTAPQLTEEEQLVRGLQRFRDANQRSMSERSRASSQADRSKSQSRPPTPSAVVIERRVSTPIPSQQAETLVEASLIVRPIDDLDLEEEALRREGLLTDSSQQSKSDVEAPSQDEEEESKLGVSDYSIGPSSEELNAALDELRTQADSTYEEEKGESVEAESIKYSDDVRASDDETFSRRSYERYLLEETSGKEDEEELETKSATEEKLSLQLQTEIEDFEALPTASEDEQRISEVEEAPTDDERTYEQESSIEIKETIAQETAEEKEHTLAQEQQYDYDEDYSSKQTEKPDDAAETVLTENQVEAVAFEEPPLPPPRRKSTTAVEVPPSLALMEEPSKELTPKPMQTATVQPPPQPQLPAHLGDLEVERLQVHALQAGQIMVSQLHGTQISAEELECKSGNLIVKNIALPEGFIEDIVERVRTTDRQQLLTVETQTSLQASSEERSPVREVVPPPKPPRQRDLEASKRSADTADEITLQQLRNYDEETQTDPMTYPTHHMAIPPPPPVYATTEYLQSLPPMGYYPNLRRADEPQFGTSPDSNEPTSTLQRRPHHHHHHHHRHHRRCDSSCSECDDYDEDLADREETRSRSHSRRSRSSTRPPTEPQTLAKASKQFVSACSLSLVQLLNRVTAAVRGGDPDKQVEGQVHHIPTLVALFVVISFSLIVYMLSGRSVHTHHWDFFNPPGNGARQ